VAGYHRYETSACVPNTDLRGQVVSAVAIDPRNGAIVYAAGEYYLFRSTDGGATFAALTSAPNRFSAVVVDPTNSMIHAGDFTGHVATSANGGASWTWTTLAGGGLDASPQALAVDPRSPWVVYAATFASGVYKSGDWGASFVATSNGLATLNMRSLAVNPSGVLFAGTVDNVTAGTGGLYASSNGAASWSRVLLAYYVGAVGVARSNPSVLYAGVYQNGVGSVWKSTSGGASWSQTSLVGAQLHGLAVDALNPSNVVVTDYIRGLTISRDGGASWALVGTPAAEAVATFPANHCFIGATSTSLAPAPTFTGCF
jgi:hypothetical protein